LVRKDSEYEIFKDVKKCYLGGVNPARSNAFTLAEVLITLGIIGVVAAITLPTLIQNHQKQVTVNKLKKAYSTLSQVVARSYAENGSPFENLSGEVVTADKTKEIFETYFLPYFKSPIVAENGKSLYARKDIYLGLNGNRIDAAYFTDYQHGRILFSTTDRVIMTFWIMKWSKDENEQQVALYISNARVTVDINGLKGPNTFGKDVFIFVTDFEKNKVYPYGMDWTAEIIDRNCNKNSTGELCAAKIVKDGWKIADDYPW
jgi:prepilin-type N-terminal cleavage/methylation domain-containing protein